MAIYEKINRATQREKRRSGLRPHLWDTRQVEPNYNLRTQWKSYRSIFQIDNAQNFFRLLCESTTCVDISKMRTRRLKIMGYIDFIYIPIERISHRK